MLNKFIYSLALLTLLIIFYACGTETETSKKPVSKGEALYTQYCLTCHGKNGKLGLNGAFDLSASTLEVAEIQLIVSNGRKMMTPYKNILTPEEIKAVSTYLLELRQ